MQEFTFQVFEAFTAATVILHRGQPHRRQPDALAGEAHRDAQASSARSVDERGALTWAASTSASSNAHFGYLFKEG